MLITLFTAEYDCIVFFTIGTIARAMTISIGSDSWSIISYPSSQLLFTTDMTVNSTVYSRDYRIVTGDTVAFEMKSGESITGMTTDSNANVSFTTRVYVRK